MTVVVGYLVLALVAAFWTYRQICIATFERACQPPRPPFRGVRIVIRGCPASREKVAANAGRGDGAEPSEWTATDRPLAPHNSTTAHRLRLVGRHHLTTKG